MGLLNKIYKTYGYNRPDIKGMRKLVYEHGWDVEYKERLYARWLNWLFFEDCQYELTHNDKDMRNYTS